MWRGGLCIQGWRARDKRKVEAKGKEEREEQGIKRVDGWQVTEVHIQRERRKEKYKGL